MNYPCLVWHRNLGLCEITHLTIALQSSRGVEGSLFVDHQGEAVEVTRDMVEHEWTPVTLAPPHGLPIMVRSREGNRVERRVNLLHPPQIKLCLFRPRSKVETDFEPKEWIPAP